jgi:hypothetical protein
MMLEQAAAEWLNLAKELRLPTKPMPSQRRGFDTRADATVFHYRIPSSRLKWSMSWPRYPMKLQCEASVI